MSEHDAERLYFVPTKSLLSEAEAQKIERLKRLEQKLEEERQRPALKNNGFLEFSNGNRHWPAIKAMAESRGHGEPERVFICPYPWKQEWAWKIEVRLRDWRHCTGWDGYVSHDDVMACFPDEGKK